MDFNPGKQTWLCSKHFVEKDIDRTSLACIRLREGAVPSIFDAFPAHLQPKVVKKRKAPAHRASPEHVPDGEVTLPANNSGTEMSVAGAAASPAKEVLKRKLEESEQKVAASKKKIKLLQQSKRRLKKKNAELCSVIEVIKNKSFISEQSLEVLRNCSGGVPDLLKRQAAKMSKCKSTLKYSPELRSFALTLNFYSPKAYQYVRKVFDTCLPHPRTLEKWYHSVEVVPGFTEPAFVTLKSRVDAANEQGKQIYCALVMDEIAIRQHVEWDGNKYHGYIDMGTKLDDDTLPVAKEALVFMVVALNSSWKMQVGYFLINGLAANERGNLVVQCIKRLHSVGIRVESLTFDGASSNVAMVKQLGCDFDTNNMKSHFSHPITESPVRVFLDPYHMLKLVRNALGDMKAFTDSAGNTVMWRYIERLHQLQENEGLHLGNKLRASHIAWVKKKMNVKLAAQLLSDSVADSLQFCLDEKIEGFEGCEGTIQFIRTFNVLFDILNSRNLCSNGWKVPLQSQNESKIKTALNTAKIYIASLKVHGEEMLVIKCRRKMGFLGFLICINSVLNMFDGLVMSPSPPLKFLTTYKMSQDHIELFFGKIRSMGGWNNNPTCRQFSAAYKKILVNNDIKDVTRGNCLPIESVQILTVSSGYHTNISSTVPSVLDINMTCTKTRLCDSSVSNENDSESEEDPCISSSMISQFSEKIVAYIAGFVCSKLRKSITCDVCNGAIVNSNVSPVHSLINVKNKGGLCFPSEDVINISLTCEKIFRENVLCSKSEGKNVLNRYDCHKIVHEVLKLYLDKAIFRNISSHMTDTEPNNNHIIFLIKAIAETYLQVRYSYAAKQFTVKFHANKTTNRQTLSRLVIFRGQ